MNIILDFAKNYYFIFNILSIVFVFAIVGYKAEKVEKGKIAEQKELDLLKSDEKIIEQKFSNKSFSDSESLKSQNLTKRKDNTFTNIKATDDSSNNLIQANTVNPTTNNQLSENNIETIAPADVEIENTEMAIGPKIIQPVKKSEVLNDVENLDSSLEASNQSLSENEALVASTKVAIDSVENGILQKKFKSLGKSRKKDMEIGEEYKNISIESMKENE